MSEVVLLDGDVFVYRVGFASNDAPLEIAQARLNQSIDTIMDALEASELQVWLSPTDKSNFRYQVYPEYKANRALQDKPVWYHQLREYLLSDYEAKIATGMEADDALGINQRKNSVIVTIDKDLDQIPGNHYNFVKELSYYVNLESAMRYFYFQLLCGDSTDNIPGVPRVGKVRANVILDRVETEDEMQRICLDHYRRAYKKDGMTNMIKFGQCLKIKQTEDEGLWQPEYVLDDIKKVGIKKAPWRDW